MSPDFSKTIQSFTLKPLPNSEILLEGTLESELVASYEKDALKNIAQKLVMPGFRQGHVPGDMVRKKVGDKVITEEAIELCLQSLYPTLITERKIDAIGKPMVRIASITPNTPIAISIQTAIYPIVELPKGWQDTGKKIPLTDPAPVVAEDIDKALTSLQQSRKGEADALPELNDAFAQSLGKFENLEALKKQIEENIIEERNHAARDARRGKIIDALLEKTTVAIPQLFIDSELDKIIAQMREDLTRMGMTLENYLEQSKKTESSVRDDFRSQAEKRAKLQLVLNKIAETEKMEVDAAAVDEEMKHALEHFPEARKDLLRVHIETVLRNDKVLQLLELESKKE